MENVTPGHDGKQTLKIVKTPEFGSVSVGVGVGVLPLGQVLTATVQAELLILFVFSDVAVEVELLSAEFMFVFVFVLLSACLSSDSLYAKEFCIIGIIVVAPTTSIDVIATIIRPLIVWFIIICYLLVLFMIIFVIC
jgi:hypothetical protein